MRRGVWIGWLLSIGACAPRAETPLPAGAPAGPLAVDTSVVRSAADVSGWRWRRTDTTDLDADGDADTLVLAADVTVSPAGEPLWEDGHRWALVVEDATERTLLYAAFVPMGHVEVAVMSPDAGGQRRVLVLERSPQRLRALAIEYSGDGERDVAGSDFAVERWVPGVGAGTPP
jgi:hypothetical protein